jgi:predicted ATPase/DNA-binding SARP family transcriptional activator
VRIGLLGTLQVQDDAGNPVRIGGHRVRSLLILLALDPGRVVSSASLIARLWPEDEPGDAANALQTIVSRLRSALRPTGVIESHPVGYRLVIDPRSVDVAEFEELAREGSAALAAGDPAAAAGMLREALAIWRGPALADAADADFATGPAAHLEELRLAALQDRIEADLALGESPVGELRSLVAASPLAERSRALLMRALVTAGRQADALAVYTEARMLLSDQLGVDPSPDLEQAYLAVLRQDFPKRAVATPQAAPPRPAVLRPPVVRKPRASFVGREADLRGVREQLGEHRLVTLTGPGGIGKTRLAAEVAGALEGTPVHTVELARVTSGTDVPFAVLDAVSGRERSIARRTPDPAARLDPLDRLGATLADRDAVIILDNCEHLVDATAEVADRMLAECPRVRILATSREPLRITGEALWPVAPLPEDAAVRLLTDRAAAVAPGFRVDSANADAVGRICRALDGMPLAIELAAAWLRVLSPAQLAERLDDRFALLTGGSRSAMARHQTLRAVVDWSWESLSKPERILARRLSVFPGGVTLETAEGACADTVFTGNTGLPARDVLAALSGLVDKSILMAGEGRYRMLETVRAYGQERLAEASEDEQVKSEFIRYYLDLAETADPLLRTAEQPRWLRELDAELGNLYGAIRLTIGREDSATALRFVRALGWYWMIRETGEAQALAREVLRLPAPADEGSQLMTEARVSCVLTAAGKSWDVDAVRPDLVGALQQLAERFPAPAELHPMAAFGEPMLALHDQDPGRALAAFESYEASAGPWDRAAMTLMRSQICAMMGRQTEAEELIVAANDVVRSLGDEWLLAAGLTMVADFAGLRGDHETSIAALGEAAEVCDHFGAAIDRGHFEGKLAALQIRLGDLDAAHEHLDRAGDLARKHPDSGVWLEFVRAELAWAAGDMEEATRRCEAILAELGTKNSVWWQSFRATVGARFAMVALRTGDRARAKELLAEALHCASTWVEQPALATVIDTIAVLAVEEDPVLAATLLGAGHTIRGCFDESSLDAPAVRATAKRALTADAFDAAYQRGRDLPYDEAVALAGSVTAPPTIATSPPPAPSPPPSRRSMTHRQSSMRVDESSTVLGRGAGG